VGKKYFFKIDGEEEGSNGYTG